MRNEALTRWLGKLLVLIPANAIALLALPTMAQHHNWVAVAVTVAVVLAVNAVYLTRRAIPAKYLVPATLFFVLFQLYPVAYTMTTAFSNYGTGNLLSKDQAIQTILEQSKQSSEGAQRFSMAILQSKTGEIRLLLQNESGERFIASKAGLTSLPDNHVERDGIVTEVGPFKRLTLHQVVDLGPAVTGFVVPSPSGDIHVDTLTSASASVQRLVLGPKGTIVDQIDGTIYRPKSGTFTSADHRTLTPGFRATIGLQNFTRSFSDSGLRSAFVRVFIWNVSFAVLSVLLDSTLGLALAMALNSSGMKFRGVYRSLLVLPYAMPSVLTMLIWSQGILNTGYGAINRVLGTQVGWLDRPWLARISLLVINMWLGFGYKFVLFSGQLQSIPGDLAEAAQVDGASPRQAFRHITFPLLLTGIAPMLISSFAFNFNNAVLMLAVTGGGPPVPGSTSVAGETDILLSYTYKIAFAGGRGQDYGYASALTVLIFFLVGAITLSSFRFTRQFEELR